MNLNSVSLNAEIVKLEGQSIKHSAKFMIEELVSKVNTELITSFDKTQKSVWNTSEKKSLGELDPFRVGIANFDLRAALEDFTPFVSARFQGKLARLVAEYGEPVLNEHYLVMANVMLGANPEESPGVRYHFAIFRIFDKRFGEMIGTLDLSLDTDTYSMSDRKPEPESSEEKPGKRGHLSVIK